MTIQERLDAIKKEYTELEEQVRNITQRMHCKTYIGRLVLFDTRIPWF